MEESYGNISQRNAMIFYRLKPSNDFSYENIKVQDDYKVVHARRVQDCSPNMFNAPLYLEYKCESVFYRHPQRNVYASVMKDVLASVVEGCDATILSYGQTGSGKTYTMTGLRNNFEETGLIPRFFAELFELQTKRVLEFQIVCKMAYVELIEPNGVKDLLVNTADKKIMKLKYRDRLMNASRLVIPSETDALRLLFCGESRRSIGDTAVYPGANRSHTVLTIYIESRSTNKSLSEITYGKIHFVDMMGTNCANNKRSHLPPRVQGQGNLAKMLLEQYLGRLNRSVDNISLSQNWTSIVLDYIGESLNPQAIMRFIGHINGSAKDLEVTHSTLRFGTVVEAIKPLPLSKCIGLDMKQQQINDQEELDRLNKYLAMSRACEKEQLLNYGEARLSVARVDHLRRLVPHYLLGNVPEEVVIALHQTPLFLELCREHIYSMKREKREDFVLLEALRKEEEEALLMERAMSLENTASPDRASLSSRTRSNLRELSAKSQESQRSIRSISKEGSGVKIGKSGKSIDKLKRNTSEFSKKSKNSSVNARSSFPRVSSNEILNEYEFPIQRVPSRSAGWAQFMLSAAAKEMHDVIRDTEVADKLANEEFEITKTSVMAASQHLEEARKERYLAQKLRHLTSEETYTPRGSVFAGNQERMWNLLCKEREDELNKKMEEMHAKKLLKSETAKNLSNARRKIESNYQAFCIATYGVATQGPGLVEVEDDASGKSNKSFELFYYKMQDNILLHSSSEKKKRKQSYISDKSFSEDLPFKNTN